MIGIIADDLTGSGDVGLHFADRGLDTVIQVEQDSVNAVKYRSCDVFIINTDTRYYEPQAAYEKVRQACIILKALHAERVFKKIDSTLRGNICAETDALFDEFNLETLPFCAAFPSMGRTTAGGRHYVHGRLITETEFARDPRNPVKEAAINSLFEAGTKNAGSIKSCDAQTDEDLKRFAGEIIKSGLRVAAGSAGLARELADAWAGSCGRVLAAQAAKPDPGPHPVLIISATRSGVTSRQIEKLKGLHEVTAVPINFSEGKVRISDWSGGGQGDRSIVIFSDPASSVVSPDNVINVMVRLCVKLCETGHYTDLVLVGGDTAAGICRALGVKALRIIRSVLPGIAYCGDAGGRYCFVLKPGSFGTDDTLVKCYRFLNERETKEY